VSEQARQMLRELLAEALSGNGNGHATPQVPAPPVAAVLRPSTWSQPPAPGEVIGDAPAPAPASAGDPRAAGGGPRVAAGGGPRVAAGGDGRAAGGGAHVERVSLRSDDDLARFAAHVLANAAAVRDGALRFTLGEARSGVRRIERGAVTERTVNEAAQAGQRLVLAPAAVLTPLAKERARHLKVEIERERRC
jgi:hypothetical protein